MLSEAEKLIASLDLGNNPNADPGTLADKELLSFSKKPIEKALTGVQTERLQLEAVELFKGVQLFAGAVINQMALDYHVTLAQSISSKCVKEIELQNEVILQLIKQTTKHPYPNRFAFFFLHFSFCFLFFFVELTISTLLPKLNDCASVAAALHPSGDLPPHQAGCRLPRLAFKSAVDKIARLVCGAVCWLLSQAGGASDSTHEILCCLTP